MFTHTKLPAFRIIRVMWKNTQQMTPEYGWTPPHGPGGRRRGTSKSFSHDDKREG